MLTIGVKKKKKIFIVKMMGKLQKNLSSLCYLQKDCGYEFNPLPVLEK